MRSLPLFHRVAGQPVVVLGAGAAAEPKRRLVERAGGEVIDDLQAGIDRGARLAFIAHDDPAMQDGDAIRARCAGLLVNVVDRPDLCDFTVPSIVDRDPLLLAVGTSGASAGLAKHVRLRLDALLPAGLGQLATALEAARAGLRARWPQAAERRRALDGALAQGGLLDPLVAGAEDKVADWLAGEAAAPLTGRVELMLTSNDPDDLTLRQARLLGMADAVLHDVGVAAAVLNRARADAVRLPLPHHGPDPAGLVIVIMAVNY